MKTTELATKGYICPSCNVIDLENEGTLMAGSGATEGLGTDIPYGRMGLFSWEEDNNF